MAAHTPRFIASGNILPSTFVKIDAANNFHVLQAGAATDNIIGVAQDATYNAPGVAGSDGYAAHSGQPITVYGDGEEALVVAGAAITEGQYLTSTASGTATPILYTAGATHIFQGGVALESANSGELVRILVKVGPIYGISA